MKPLSERGPVWLSWFFLILLSLMWGSSFILIKHALADFTPMEIGPMRIFLGSLVVFPWAIPFLRQTTGREWAFLAFSGLCGNLLPSLLFSTAGAHLASGISGSLNALTPMFTMLISAFLFRQSVGWAKLVGVLTGFLGAILLVSQGSGFQWEGLNAWALLIVLATLCYGININHVKYNLAGLDPLKISALSLMAVGFPAGLVAMLTTDVVPKALSPQHWEAFSFILILGISSTALATILFNRLVKLASPVFASSTTYIIPVVAVGWGLVDGESLTWFHLAGLALVVVGVLLVNRKK